MTDEKRDDGFEEALAFLTTECGCASCRRAIAALRALRGVPRDDVREIAIEAYRRGTRDTVEEEYGVGKADMVMRQNKRSIERGAKDAADAILREELGDDSAGGE